MWITGSMGGVLSRGAIEAVSVLVLLQIINFMAYVACHCLTATLEKCACESWRRFSFFLTLVWSAFVQHWVEAMLVNVDSDIVMMRVRESIYI